MNTSWLQFYRHIKAKTNIILVSSCDKYRKMAHELPRSHESVLEIGSSTGLTTIELAQSARQVIAVETSFPFFEQAQQEYAHIENIQFVRLDARDIESVKEVVAEPDIIFLDIGGDAQLGNVSSILRLYMVHFTPRLFVVRNFELAMLMELVTDTEIPEESRRVKSVIDSPDNKNIQHLLDLSYSEVLSDRAFAARKLKAIPNELAQERVREMCEDVSPKIQKICARW